MLTDRVGGKMLSIGGQQFQRGFGTHANSVLRVLLNGETDSFSAWVGGDDEVGKLGSVEFVVTGDGRELYRSGVMHGGDTAKRVMVDLHGVQLLVLEVKMVGNNNNNDHADWAGASFQVSGASPVAYSGSGALTEILTPKPGPQPRFTGPQVFGVRPGSPFLFRVSATGRRPLTFGAENLPAGLTLNPQTGIITGTAGKAGTYEVKLTARNELGSATRDFRVVVGERICLTPPMGWNSWNCWAGAVNQDRVMRSAEAIINSGLADHGWSYVNIDDTWQGRRGGPFNALQGNEKFPNLKALCDNIHALGLRAGIYSTPWVSSYAGFPGESSNSEDGAWIRSEKDERGYGPFSFEQNDAQQWAAWGIDYLKYDWGPIDLPHMQKMANALRSSGRDIAYSLSNSAPYELAPDFARDANCWRTTGDITDNWGNMSGIGFSQDPWCFFAGPGHWNDPDMLVVGNVGWGEQQHPTHLTPDEQYTHISLWCLLSAPLLLGCDLEQLDPFTLSLLTNDEVLDIDQDPLGKPARRVAVSGETEVWCKYLEDGGEAVGLFNQGTSPAIVTAQWPDLFVRGKQQVRDLWRQKDLGVFTGHFETTVPPHGVVLVKMTPVG